MAAATTRSRLLGSMSRIVLALMLLALAGGCSGAGRTSSPPPTVAPPTPSPTATLSATPTAAPTETPTPAATAAVEPIPTASTPPALRARIEIVWPHDNAPVSQATKANITAYLMALDHDSPPACAWEPTVRLWAALNAEPARPIAIGQKRMQTASGRTFPVWDFNDVDVSAAQQPGNKITFFATVDDVRTYHNIWVHAQDARTIVPEPHRPDSLLSKPPAEVDTRIEIVWPHGSVPVDQADLANITVYLFAAETLDAVSADTDWEPTVLLHHALNAQNEDPAAFTPAGSSREIPAGEEGKMLAWDFNDVDVSAARDRLNKLYFWVSVNGLVAFPNIWAHGADTPTVFPQLDVLESCR